MVDPDKFYGQLKAIYSDSMKTAFGCCERTQTQRLWNVETVESKECMTLFVKEQQRSNMTGISSQLGNCSKTRVLLTVYDTNDAPFGFRCKSDGCLIEISWLF